MPQFINFTSFGLKAKEGPTKTQITDYFSESLLYTVASVGKGIQKWRIPLTGEYLIEAAGASGLTQCPTSIGGKGAKFLSKFNLVRDDILYILVGQQGFSYNDHFGGAGGGATYIAKKVSNEKYFLKDDNCYVKPLLVAAGGGGSGDCNDGTTNKIGSGGHCLELDEEIISGQEDQSNAGAGFSTSNEKTYSFLSGGIGGSYYDTYWKTTVYGGFGGGGAPLNSGGGGGGFRGGNSGTYINGEATAGEGGYSFNSGRLLECESDYNEGNGYVIIKLPKSHLCTIVNPYFVCYNLLTSNILIIIIIQLDCE